MDYFQRLPEGVVMPPDESVLLDTNDHPISYRKAFISFTWSGSFVSMQDKTKDELIMLEFPHNRKGKGNAVSARPGLIESVYSGSKNKALCINFLDWFSNSAEAAVILKNVRGVLPSSVQRAALMSDPALLSDGDKKINAIVDQVYNKAVNPYSAGPGDIYTLFNEVNLRSVGAEVAFGRITPQQAGQRYEEILRELDTY
jgi:multiple sugar transport system substrate-binding protein